MVPTSRVLRLATLTIVSLVACSASTGCLQSNRFLPESNWYLASRDLATYPSTSWMPQTVTVVDSRTGETIWSVDVPVGQQVVIDFNKGGGSDEYYPDTMRWGFFAAGTGNGRLRNKIAVPPADSRVVEPSLRPAPEMPGTTYSPGEIPEPILLQPLGSSSETDDASN